MLKLLTNIFYIIKKRSSGNFICLYINFKFPLFWGGGKELVLFIKFLGNKTSQVLKLNISQDKSLNKKHSHMLKISANQLCMWSKSHVKENFHQMNANPILQMAILFGSGIREPPTSLL